MTILLRPCGTVWLAAIIMMSSAAGLCPSSARAQVGLGAEVGPEAWVYADAGAKRDAKAQMTPSALAISLAFDATTWMELSVSTIATPSQELFRLQHRGYYKLELLQLVLLAKHSRSILPKLIAQRDKNMSMRDISKDLQVDFDPIYEESLALGDRIEKEILPKIMRVSVNGKVRK